MPILPNTVGAHLLFERRGHVLLGLRPPDALFAANIWHVPAGHVERESVRACAVREADEELGITVAEPDLELVHTVHLLHADNSVPRLQLFFRVHRWQGEPQLMEPDRCVEWRWWPLHALPEPTVEYTVAALEGMANGWPYTDMGWPR
ncbi:NUDIX domain-containing protein [Streptomyces triculaminicus]|uniref:NUDIX domain-containing protein n=1 Tax=Streptomyces triculaminicus TaxID=2816232 RepID=A0A939JSD8_9ACTN|nr:NUDIX domain-containing protein [Streptomyces triculaminicus]MBO0654569.1 NUDIX domain-containing protein [Streptomyces triculaminicus]